MLNDVLQNVDMVPLVLIALSDKVEIEETVAFCDFLRTPSNRWFPPTLNSIVEVNPFRMAYQLYMWLHHDHEMPEWFRLKGGEAYNGNV